MMMSFCRKITPHSLLGLTTTTTTTTSIDEHEKLPLKCHHNYISSLPNAVGSGGGLLGLVTKPNYDHIKHQPFVLESSSIKSSSSSNSSFSFSSSSSDSASPPSPPAIFQFETKKDPGGIGFIDDIGGGVDGLMSCTESLGFESSDERRVDDHQIVEGINHVHPEEEDYHGEEDACLRMMRQPMKRVSKWTRTGERKAEAKKFPPPLSSLNQNGQPKYYLRPVRKDGRLELTEVRIYRPEILRAYRENGRLRLHLVSHEKPDLQEEEEQLAGIQEEIEEEEEEEVVDEEENIDNVNNVREEESGEWKLTVGGEGFRRCHSLVSRHHVHHHHGNLPVWSQQQHCVTTR